MQPGQAGPVPAYPSETCVVKLVCVRLGPGAVHCGLELTDTFYGVTILHIMDTTGGLFPLQCIYGIGNKRFTVWRPQWWSRQFGPPTWWIEKRWPERYNPFRPNKCDCIRAAAAALNNAIPTPMYWPIPENDCAGGNPTCNSNYATKCLLKHCGFDYRDIWGASGAPVGWNHRMKRCLKPSWSIVGTEFNSDCVCECKQWQYVDLAWCGTQF